MFIYFFYTGSASHVDPMEITIELEQLTLIASFSAESFHLWVIALLTHFSTDRLFGLSSRKKLRGR